MSGSSGGTVTRQFHVYDNNGNDVTSECVFELNTVLSCLTVDKNNNLLISDGSMNDGTYFRVLTATYPDENLTASAAVNVSIDDDYDYSYTNLTFTALENGTFTLTIPGDLSSSALTSVSYSTDMGSTWTITQNVDNQTVTITTPTITKGNKVLWKGEGYTYCDTNTPVTSSMFSSTGRFNVSGNIMSLLYLDNFVGQTSLPTQSQYFNTFSELFMNTQVRSAANLALPATTLARSCYISMFKGCSVLTSAPQLPATTLTVNCYSGMFLNCALLTEAPALNATSLTTGCYAAMFSGCASLSSITMLATDISATNCLFNWVNGVAATGTFTKAASQASLPSGASGIPENWTVVDA